MGDGNNVTDTQCNGVEPFRLTTVKHNPIGLKDDQVFDGRHPTADQKKRQPIGYRLNPESRT